MRTSPAPLLAPDEQREFEYILERARHLGWITAGQDLVAIPSSSTVTVRSTHGPHKQYRHVNDRWLYELLGDLAQGLWRESSWAVEEATVED